MPGAGPKPESERPRLPLNGQVRTSSMPADGYWVGLLDHDPRRGLLRRAGKLLPRAFGDGAICGGVHAAGLRDNDGVAAIGGFPDRHIERHFAQELHAQFVCFSSGAAVAEDVAALAAMGAEEIAHVLD